MVFIYKKTHFRLWETWGKRRPSGDPGENALAIESARRRWDELEKEKLIDKMRNRKYLDSDKRFLIQCIYALNTDNAFPCIPEHFIPEIKIIGNIQEWIKYQTCYSQLLKELHHEVIEKIQNRKLDSTDKLFFIQYILSQYNRKRYDGIPKYFHNEIKFIGGIKKWTMLHREYKELYSIIGRMRKRKLIGKDKLFLIQCINFVHSNGQSIDIPEHFSLEIEKMGTIKNWLICQAEYGILYTIMNMKNSTIRSNSSEVMRNNRVSPKK